MGRGYSAAQCDLIGQLQLQKKHLSDEVAAFRSGKKYLDMEASHTAAMQRQRNDYERLLSEKNRELESARKEADHVRRIFMEANEDVLEEKEKAEAQHQRELARMQKKIDEKDQVIDSLKGKIRDLENQLVDANKKIHDQEEKIEKLNSRLKKNSKNSSIPTSKTGFRGKVTNGRTPSGKKPGAQDGHEGHPRPDLAPTKVVELPTPSWILADPDWVPITGEGAFKSQKIVECHLSVDVTEYRSFGFRNEKTGETFYAPLPGKTDLELEYGDSVKSLAFVMNNVLHVPVRKTNQFFQWAADGALKNGPSTGWINGLTREFSSKSETDKEEMFNQLVYGDIMYTDQTTIRINGILKNVTVCTDKEKVMYFVKDHKGFEGYNGTPTELFQGILVHDGDKTLMHYGSKHQLCNAHEIRYLQAAKEDEPNKIWAGQMQDLLKEGIHLRNQAEGNILPEKTVVDIENRFDAIIKLGEKEFADNPPTLNRDPFNTFQRIKTGKDSLLGYLRNPEVDPTNNVAERCARALKGKLNVSGTFRSGLNGRDENANASAQYYCDALGAIETAKNQGKNPYQFAKEVFGRDAFSKAASKAAGKGIPA